MFKKTDTENDVDNCIWMSAMVFIDNIYLEKQNN